VGVGALAVCLVLASPVVVTAWGADFPDSAAISYILGGLACLVMPTQRSAAKRRWQVAAAVLLTAAVWSLATTALLVAAAVVVVAVRTAVRRGLVAMLADLLWLAIGAVATTIALGVGSWLVLGRFDYVVPTIQAVLFLATPAQTALWRSTNWRWALGDAYLLVLPATCVAWAMLAVRRRVPSPAVAIGIIASLQLAVAAAGQFGGSMQLLEEHYLSSPLWAASLLSLTVVIAELTRALTAHPVARWLPAALVIGVALLSEAAPPVPAFGWLPWGAGLAALVVALAATVAWLPGRLPGVGTAAAVAILGALMVLTVAPNPTSAKLPGTVFDPPTGYQGALGGSWRTAADDYRLEQAVRRLVPNATYQGEQLVDCFPSSGLLEAQLIGLFHSSVNTLPGGCPNLGPAARAEIRSRNVAQLVVMTPNERLDVPVLMQHLAGLHPRLARFASLHSGTESVQVALIDFPAADGRQYHP
jgi:MFS family permease